MLEKLDSEDQDMEEEDDDDIELPEALIKKTKSVAVPFAGLSGKPKEEEKSKVYHKRHKIFTEMK